MCLLKDIWVASTFWLMLLWIWLFIFCCCCLPDGRNFFCVCVMGRGSPPHGLGDLSFPNRGLTWKLWVLTTALPGISQEKLFWRTWFVSSILVLGHQSNMVNKVKKEPKPSRVLRMEVLIQMACKFENYEKRDWGFFWSSSVYLLFMVCFFVQWCFSRNNGVSLGWLPWPFIPALGVDCAFRWSFAVYRNFLFALLFVSPPIP